MSNDVLAEEALWACCHQAAALAQAEGSARIEIAHLVLALLETQAGRDAFAHERVDIHLLAQAAARHLELSERSATSSAPEASAGFLQVLRRVEQAAIDARRNTVTLRCLVMTLLERASDLDGGTFLQDARSCMRPTHLGRTGGSENGREDAVARMRSREDHRARDRDRRQQRDADARRAAKRAHVTAQAVAAKDIDPFQLRVDLQAHDDAESANRKTRTNRRSADHSQRMRASSSDNDTAVATSAESLEDFDHRMRQMQQQLSTIAEQMQLLTSDRNQSARSDAKAQRDWLRRRHSAPADGLAEMRGPSERDWARIAQLLRQLDAGPIADAGRGCASGSGSRSLRRRQRATKSRIRAARQTRRRRLQERLEQPERDRLVEPWNTRDSQRQPDRRLPMASDTVESDEPGWEDEDGSGGKRFYLELDDAIVRAPSIGPRTAERLTPHGIERVRDLLSADATDLAERIKARHITKERLESWQMQARLVCTVPWLRGTHAQLLVGAGYTTPAEICAVSGDELSADVLKFASTRDGQRVLRSGPPPELDKILRWAECAAEAELDRAA